MKKSWTSKAIIAKAWKVGANDDLLYKLYKELNTQSFTYDLIPIIEKYGKLNLSKELINWLKQSKEEQLKAQKIIPPDFKFGFFFLEAKNKQEFINAAKCLAYNYVEVQVSDDINFRDSLRSKFRIDPDIIAVQAKDVQTQEDCEFIAQGVSTGHIIVIIDVTEELRNNLKATLNGYGAELPHHDFKII